MLTTIHIIRTYTTMKRHVCELLQEHKAYYCLAFGRTGVFKLGVYIFFNCLSFIEIEMRLTFGRLQFKYNQPYANF